MPRLGEAGRATSGSGEVHVAQTPPSAGGSDKTLGGCDQVAQQLAGLRVLHQRAYRHMEQKIRRGGPVAVVAQAVLAILRSMHRLVAIVEQRGKTRVGDQHDRASLAPIPAARPAALDVLLSPKCDRAIATVAGLHRDPRFIDELHRGTSARQRYPGARRRPCRFYAGTTWSPAAVAG